MAEFNDVTSGFDIETIVNPNLIRHFIQLLADSDSDGLWYPEAGNSETGGRIGRPRSMFKNLPGILRAYSPNYEYNTSDLDYMLVRDYGAGCPWIYILISPIDFQLFSELLGSYADVSGDVFVVIRLAKSWSPQPNIQNVLSAEDDNIYEHYSDIVRVEGLINTNRLEDSPQESDFLDAIRVVTSVIYEKLADAHESGDVNAPQILAGAFEWLANHILLDSDSEEGYEIFLRAFHNISGISRSIRQAVNRIPPAFTELIATICARSFDHDECCFGMYANFNTPNHRTRGNYADAQMFSETDCSGLAINLSNQLLEDLLLLVVRTQMQNLLDEGTITQQRFNQVQYEYPFQVPVEILPLDDIPEGIISFFEIKSVSAKFKKHRFNGRGSTKREAVKLTVALSNINQEVYQLLFGSTAPNPRIHFWVGFEPIGANHAIILDGDINIPFPILAVLLFGPFRVDLNNFSGVGHTAFWFLGNLIINLLTRDMQLPEVDPNAELVLATKRWDPFYVTDHTLNLFLPQALINEDILQVKLGVRAGIGRHPRPHNRTYIPLMTVAPGEEIPDRIQYNIGNSRDVIRVSAMATDRIVDLYTLTSLEDVIDLNFSDAALTVLSERARENKILTFIPCTPHCVERRFGAVAKIGFISEARTNEIIDSLRNTFIQNQMNYYFEQFLDLVSALIPTYDRDSIDDEQRDLINKALWDWISQSELWESYQQSGLQEDFNNYLVSNPDELVHLSPSQLARFGMDRQFQIDATPWRSGPDIVFPFVDLTGYQAVRNNNRVYIRNIPNNNPADNLSTLPDCPDKK